MSYPANQVSDQPWTDLAHEQSPRARATLLRQCAAVIATKDAGDTRTDAQAAHAAELLHLVALTEDNLADGTDYVPVGWALESAPGIPSVLALLSEQEDLFGRAQLVGDLIRYAEAAVGAQAASALGPVQGSYLLLDGRVPEVEPKRRFGARQRRIAAVIVFLVALTVAAGGVATENMVLIIGALLVIAFCVAVLADDDPREPTL